MVKLLVIVSSTSGVHTETLPRLFPIDAPPIIAAISQHNDRFEVKTGVWVGSPGLLLISSSQKHTT